MKTILTILFLFAISFDIQAQTQYSFNLTTGNTGNWMRYNGTASVQETGYLKLGQSSTTPSALQRLHIMGGNILLSSGTNSSGGSGNGNIYFGLHTSLNATNGIWGIEYHNTGGYNGLNFYKPGPTNNSLPDRMYAFFLQDDGLVGIGTGNPMADLHIKGGKEVAKLRIESTGIGSLEFASCDGSITIESGKSFGIYSGSKMPGNLTRMTIDADGNFGFNGENSRRARYEFNGTTLILGHTAIGDELTPASLIVSSLRSKSGKRIVITDENGLLSFSDDMSNIPGDNLGNHLATSDIVLNQNGLKYGNANLAALTINDLNDICINSNLVVKSKIYGPEANGRNWNKLEIYGSRLPDAGRIEVCDGSDDNWRSIKYITQGTTADHQFWVDGRTRLNVKKDRVTIGDPQEFIDLNVNGMINCREVKVSLSTYWPDYVFDEDYRIISLSEVESFIKNNRHLPGVPSETEIAANGINVAEMNSILLKKIEELTLYMIELEKKYEALEQTLEK